MNAHVQLPEIVDADISDLFYNTDHENARIVRYGKFEGWNESELRENARMFIQTLWRLGVRPPSEEALLRDFYGRQV